MHQENIIKIKTKKRLYKIIALNKNLKRYSNNTLVRIDHLSSKPIKYKKALARIKALDKLNLCKIQYGYVYVF